MKPLFYITLLACLFLTGCSTQLTAQSKAPESSTHTQINPFAQNTKLGRGINFGNALEAPTEGEWGFTLQAEYFSLVKSKGFDSIRVPIRWSAHTRDSAPYTIDESFFERVDWVLEQSAANDLMVIINIHHYNEIFENPAAEQAKFLAMWRQISKRYADQPASVLFEILNEPHNNLTAEIWNDLLPQALQIIRKFNPHRTVVIGAAEWGGIPGLLKLEIPSDNNLIVSVHYYEPFKFTHQGAGWVNDPDADSWVGTQWTGAEDEVNAIRDHFQTIVDWGKQRKVPINIGEFGAYSKADSVSRGLWSREVVRFALQNDMSYHYWEFGSGFGIYNPKTKTWNEALLEGLIETTAMD